MDRLGGLGGPIQVEVGDDNLRAFLGQAQADGSAQALRAARDKGDFVLQWL